VAKPVQALSGSIVAILHLDFCRGLALAVETRADGGSACPASKSLFISVYIRSSSLSDWGLISMCQKFYGGLSG
jgi:hypothetical protein